MRGKHPAKGESFSIIRLNGTETGWGVVDDASGALVHINGLALRLTRERARIICDDLNEAAKPAKNGVVFESRRGGARSAKKGRPPPRPARCVSSVEFSIS